MHAPDFPTRLRALGLSRRGFARLIAGLAGQQVRYRTVERWGYDTKPPDAALALIAVLEQCPELICTLPVCSIIDAEADTVG